MNCSPLVGARRDGTNDAEFADRREEFAKKLGELEEDIGRSELPSVVSSRLVALHGMVASCSHNEDEIKQKARLVMDAYAYPVRKAAQESVRRFGERDFDNLTGIPESQWIIAKMIFESHSKGMKGATGIETDSVWKRRWQKLIWRFTSKEGVGGIIYGAYSKRMPYIFSGPITSIQEDVEAIRAPWSEKTISRRSNDLPVPSRIPRKVGGLVSGGAKAYVAAGLLAGVVAGPILGHRVDKKRYYLPHTWVMGLKADEKVVRVFDDSFDLPDKLGERGEGYYKEAYNLGSRLKGETNDDGAKARLEWVKGQPAVLEFLQQRSLTAQRSAPMRVVDSRKLLVGTGYVNPDTCSSGMVERQEQEKTATEKAAENGKKSEQSADAKPEAAKSIASTPKNALPKSCTTTFGWTADPDVGFSDIFQDGKSQTRIKPKDAKRLQTVATVVPVKPDGSYDPQDLASYMPVSNPNDGYVKGNRVCCAISIRYEELADGWVLNRAPGSADMLVADLMADLYPAGQMTGRRYKFVDGAVDHGNFVEGGKVKAEVFSDPETVQRMVKGGQILTLSQGRMMKDLGILDVQNANFLQSKTEARPVQRFVAMCAKGDDPIHVKREGRDEFLSAWIGNVKAANPKTEPVMDSVPEDVLGTTLDKTLADKRGLTADSSKEYEQGKLRTEFKGLALNQTAFDILYANRDILGVVRGYEAPAAEYHLVKPRASGFIYAMAQHKKANGNVTDFSLAAPAPDGSAHPGSKVNGARTAGYISRTGEVEDGKAAKSGAGADTQADPAVAKFWENQVGFANMVRGVEDSLHDSKGKAAKAEGKIFSDALDTVYGRDWARMRTDIETELYRVLSATDNNGTDPKARAEKAAFDRRKSLPLEVTGKGADMKVTLAGKNVPKQLKAFVFEYVHVKLDAAKQAAK